MNWILRDSIYYKGSRIIVDLSIYLCLGGMIYEVSTRLILDISNSFLFRNFQYISMIYLSEYSDRYLRDNATKIRSTSIELGILTSS